MTLERLRELVETSEFVGEDSITMFTPYRSGKIAHGLWGAVIRIGRDGASVVVTVEAVKRWLARVEFIEVAKKKGRGRYK